MEPSIDPIRGLYVGVPTLGILVAGVLLYWIHAQAWDRRDARWFAVMVGAGQVLGTMHLVYVLVRDPFVTRALFFAQLVVAFVTFSLFVVFTSVYTDRSFHERRPIRIGLVVAVGGMAVLAVTEWVFDHGWLVADAVIVTEPVTYVRNDPGVGFVALVVVLMALLGYSWYVLVFHLVTTQYRSGLQITLVLLAGLSVALFESLGHFGVFPADGFHHAPWGLVVFAVLSAVALFRLQLFDVQPVARTVVVENLHDPIVILDRDRRLVDYNRRAEALWPSIDGLVGEPFESVSATVAAELRFPAADAATTSGDSTPPEAPKSGGQTPPKSDWQTATEPAQTEPNPSGQAATKTTQQVTLPVGDGRERHYSVTATAVRRRHSDDVGWYAILLRDVTDIERSRRQLSLQNERLDQVASTISHDLRNPIQVADGFTELAIDDLRDLADSEPAAADALANLARIDGAMDRMEEIVENVLVLAREGRSVEDPVPVELAAVAADAWEHVDTSDAALDLAVDSSWTVDADRQRLLSILENLFRNAIEHAADHAEPRPSARDARGDAIEPDSTVRATGDPSAAAFEDGRSGEPTADDPSVTVTVDADPGRFVVADDGPGIPPEEVETVFQHGYSTVTDGTGFGLAIVRTMAESHGWSVSVDESARDGARFVFDLGTGSVGDDEGSSNGTGDDSERSSGDDGASGTGESGENGRAGERN